jgi:hypothetical protein
MTLEAASESTSAPRIDPLAALRTLAGRFLGRFLSRDLGYAERARMCASLRPGEDDLALVFEGRALARARAGYEALWRTHPIFGPAEEQTRLSVAVALSDDLIAGTSRARAFPQEYRRIAGDLRPGRVWVTWAFLEPEGAGTVYDGLVFLGKKWAWFPQPWRFLDTAPALYESPMSFWAE